jgi:hypothetical protein
MLEVNQKADLQIEALMKQGVEAETQASALQRVKSMLDIASKSGS